MIKFLFSAALAATVTLGGIAATPAAAHDDGRDYYERDYRDGYRGDRGYREDRREYRRDRRGYRGRLGLQRERLSPNRLGRGCNRLSRRRLSFRRGPNAGERGVSIDACQSVERLPPRGADAR